MYECNDFSEENIDQCTGDCKNRTCTTISMTDHDFVSSIMLTLIDLNSIDLHSEVFKISVAHRRNLVL